MVVFVFIFYFNKTIYKTSFINTTALSNPVRFLSQTQNRALAIEKLTLLKEEKKKEGLAARAAPFFFLFFFTKCGGV